MATDRKCVFGFTAKPDCNCLGSGIFAEDESGNPTEPCAFCLEDAILAGEIDGTIDGVDYIAGKPQSK